MKIAVIAGQLGAYAWTRGHFACEVIRALGERGHAVDLICDAAQDPTMFACETISLMRPFEHNMSDRPRALSAWVRAQPEPGCADAVLSLTRAVPRGVWMPLEPSIAGVIHHAMEKQDVLHMGLWLLRHHPSLSLGRVAARAIRNGQDVSSLIVFGPHAAVRARGEMAGIADRVIEAGYASTLPLVGPMDLAMQRRMVRSTLRIAPSRRVVLLSCNSIAGERLDPFLKGLNRCIGEAGADRRGWPVAVVLTPVPYAVHDAACRLGCQRALRVLGLSREPGPLFAGADCVAAPICAEPNTFALASIGRFVADGLRSGRPVVAARGAPGVDAMEIARSDAVRFVDERNATSWFEALRDVCSTDWVERAGAAAMGERGAYGLGALVDLVEGELARGAVAGA